MRCLWDGRFKWGKGAKNGGPDLSGIAAALKDVDQHADGTETIVDDYRVKHNSAANYTEWEFTLGSGTFETSSGVTGHYTMSGGGSSGNSRQDTVIYDNGVITHEFEQTDSSDHDQRLDFDRTDGSKQIVGWRESTSSGYPARVGH